EAARASAEAEASYGGIPYDWVWGPGYGPYGPYVGAGNGYGGGSFRGSGRMRHGPNVSRGQGHSSSARRPRHPRRRRLPAAIPGAFPPTAAPREAVLRDAPFDQLDFRFPFA